MITLFTIESEIKMVFKVIMLLIGVNQSDSETYLLISTIISGYVLANGWPFIQHICLKKKKALCIVSGINHQFLLGKLAKYNDTANTIVKEKRDFKICR